MFNISLTDNSFPEPDPSKKFDNQPQYLELEEIRRDGGTQPRAAINLHHVKLLEEQLEEGHQLEPVIVFYDGESYWLADGYHRWHAHRNREEEGITCVIHTGSRRDAVLYSVGANADHKPALPRSREDKRRAVMTLLNDPEWHKWSDREIARRCRVSDKTVAHLRNSADTKLNKERKAQRGGKTYTLDTTNIGRTPPDTSLLSKDDLSLIQSGTIAQSPNPDAAIVEQNNGTSQANVSLTIAHHLQLT